MVLFGDSCIFKYSSGYSKSCPGSCRKFNIKLIKTRKEIDDILSNNSIDGFIYDKCLNSKEKTEFKHFMKQYYTGKFTFVDETRDDYELCPENLLSKTWSTFGGNPEWRYILAYVKTYDTKNPSLNYLECCNINKSETDTLKQKSCSPNWCSDSKQCTIDEILLSNKCMKVFEGYVGTECASTFDQANNNVKQQFVDKHTDILVNKIGNRMYIPSGGKNWNNNATNDVTIYNQTIKNMLKSDTDTSKIQSKYKEACNDETIFDGTDWDEKLKSYGKICSCFWDPNVDNGNPANLQKNKIEALKSKDGIPDELKQYAQFVSDIDPSGPTYCWDSQCINNDENLIPNRSQCPSTNIASCLAYVNFDNKGIIKGNVSNIAKCAANLKDETLNNMLISGGGPVNKTPRNGSDTSNGSGTVPKKKKNNTTIWIIVGVVVVVLLIIIIIIAIAMSGSDPP